MHSNPTNYSYVFLRLKYWYPFIFLIGGIIAGAFFWEQMSIRSTWLHYSVLFVLLVSASLYDLKERIIPNGLIIVGFGFVLTFFYLGALDWSASLPAALGIFLFLMGIRWISSLCFGSPGIGMGDLKLFLVIALLLGWDAFWILYLAIMIGGMAALVGLLMGWIDRKTHLPFAPFIALAAATGLFLLPWEIVGGWLL